LKRILTRDTNIIAEYETTGRRNDTSEEDIERQLAGVLLAPGTAIHKSSTRHFSKQKKMKMDLSAQGVVQKWTFVKSRKMNLLEEERWDGVFYRLEGGGALYVTLSNIKEHLMVELVYTSGAAYEKQGSLVRVGAKNGRLIAGLDKIADWFY
jgi:hypothetical protein